MTDLQAWAWFVRLHSGVAPGVSEQQMIDFFESVGTVERIRMLPANARFPTGVAYVNFGIAEHATAALRFNGAVPSWNAGISVRIQRQEPLPSSHASQAVRPSLFAGMPRVGAGSVPDRRAVAEARNWVQLLSRSTGKYYWFNKATNQSIWQVPSAVLAARSALAEVDFPCPRPCRMRYILQC